MHVAIVGAGALGSVYGVRLALHGGVDVGFVVRPSRVGSTAPIVIEAVRRGQREALASPARTDVVPPSADVVLLAVGTEDLDALKAPLGASEAPIVVLTPMLPQGFARMRSAYGERVFAAMPNIIAYTRRDDGVIRYWAPPTRTLIDEPRAESAGADAVRALTEALVRAGLRARLTLGVHERNPATTVRFIAIGMALSIAGGVPALRADAALLSLARRACREGARLSPLIGAPEPWASLAPVLAAPWALRAWLGALARLSPEAVFYAEEHFGRKLKAQHRLMVREMIELAQDKGLPHAALDELARRLAGDGASTP